MTDLKVRHSDRGIEDIRTNFGWLLDDNSEVFIKLAYHILGSRNKLFVIVLYICSTCWIKSEHKIKMMMGYISIQLVIKGLTRFKPFMTLI